MVGEFSLVLLGLYIIFLYGVWRIALIYQPYLNITLKVRVNDTANNMDIMFEQHATT